jgi:hypothetical protein
MLLQPLGQMWVLTRFGEVMNPESRSCGRFFARTAEKSSYPVHVLPVSTKAKFMRSQIVLNLAWLRAQQGKALPAGA